MRYALLTLWHEFPRFFPGVLAVTFSAVLVGLQAGLLLGLFSAASLVIDRSSADVWVGSYGVVTVDQGEAIPERWLVRLASQPQVQRCEIFQQGHGLWIRPDGGTELCMIVGSRLGADALGAVPELTPALRARLRELGAVVVVESDLHRLGISGAGVTANISDQQVHVVGVVRGLEGLANAYVFCSIPTARMLLYLEPDQATYLLARCHTPATAAEVVAGFRGDSHLAAFTREDFSLRSRLYWLTKTRAGLALGWTAVLGLLVGAGITSQTLSAATAASQREYALLRAMGIPRRRMAASVAWLCLAVGIAGVVLALPIAYGLSIISELYGVHVLLPPWLLGGTAIVTLGVALASGLTSLRLVLSIDPALLLH